MNNLAIMLLLPGCVTVAATADVITFQFDSGGAAGADLDGVPAGFSVNSFLTLHATAASTSGQPFFNQNAAGFGINIAGDGADVADAFDGGAGTEAMEFTIASSQPHAGLTLVSLEFDRFTAGAGDAVRVSVDGVNLDAADDGQFDDAELSNDVLTLNFSRLTTQAVRIEYAAGNGFGLERIVFDAVAVPEPEFRGVLVAFAAAVFLFRRRLALPRRL